jgi:hypothetical protein
LAHGGAQERAFATGGELLEEPARAAIRLYVLLAERVEALLDERERDVVEHALETAAPQRARC